MSDAVNVDIMHGTLPDVVHGLNVRPWPLPREHFSEVYAHDEIEYVDDVVATMEQIHRVCRNGAIVRVTVPHFSSANAFTDPTHGHYFGRFSFSYFTGEHQFDFYADCPFRPRATSIVFHPSLLNSVVLRLANRWPERYERSWAWLFPAWFPFVELEVINPQRIAGPICDDAA